jgi:hypothetical protein
MTIQVLKIFRAVIKSQMSHIVSQFEGSQFEALCSNQTTQWRYLWMPYQHVSGWWVTDREVGTVVRDEAAVSSHFELFYSRNLPWNYRPYLVVSLFNWNKTESAAHLSAFGHVLCQAGEPKDNHEPLCPAISAFRHVVLLQK